MRVVLLTVITLVLGACGGGESGSSDYVNKASDSVVNGCAELAGVAKFAMKNRQDGVSMDNQVMAAQSVAEIAVVRNVYRLPISTSPSDAWGITQTACLKAAP